MNKTLKKRIEYLVDRRWAPGGFTLDPEAVIRAMKARADGGGS